MNEELDHWLARAEDDLRFAEVGLREQFFAQVCFLSQQCIEKCLKGALVALDRSYPKSHNLRALRKLVPELALDPWRMAIDIIDGYYVPLRYPDALPGMKSSGPPNESEAKEALTTAQEIFSLTATFLKEKR